MLSSRPTGPDGSVAAACGQLCPESRRQHVHRQLGTPSGTADEKLVLERTAIARMVAEFPDRASATNPTARPTRTSEARRGRCLRVVLVTSWYRLTRWLVEHPQLLTELNESRVEVWTPDQQELSPSRVAELLFDATLPRFPDYLPTLSRLRHARSALLQSSIITSR